MRPLAHCETYWELISASLDGGLTPEEQRRLEEHLAQCPDCRALREQLAGLEPELQALSSPGPDFTDRVMAEAARTEQDIPFTDLPQNRTPNQAAQKQLAAWWKPVRNLVLVAACCLVVLGLGRFAAQFLSAGSSSSNSTGAPMATQDSAAGSQAASQEAEEESVALPGDSAGLASGSGAADAGSAGGDGQTDGAAVPLHLEGGDYLPDGEAAELPQGFELAGTLTQAQAGDTGLAGCAYYASSDGPGVCYVAQADGRYLRWVLAGG